MCEDKGAMLELTFAIPGALSTISGGYEYCRRLLHHFPQAGVRAHHLSLPLLHPDPSAGAEADTFRVLSETQGLLLIDCLAYGAFSETLVEGFADRTIALHHHPLCLETGLSPEQSATLEQREGHALRRARAVVVTSATTADTVEKMFGVPRDRIAIARPGTVPMPRAVCDSEEACLLGVGAVIPRKGYDLLIDALATIADAPWHLDLIGPLTADPLAVADLRAQIAALDLRDRVTLHGAVSAEEMFARYSMADIFISSSLYEGYGMALAEAVNQGLPIVAARGGAVEQTAPSARFADVRDPQSFGQTLRILIEDMSLRMAAAEDSWRAAQDLPRWEETARLVADAIRRFQ
ncbi:MAG: glycosyltransferase [Neomegalonema sp.]|nr:glycosyltransferase [Neomegalonema sp.]